MWHACGAYAQRVPWREGVRSGEERGSEGDEDRGGVEGAERAGEEAPDVGATDVSMVRKVARASRICGVLKSEQQVRCGMSTSTSAAASTGWWVLNEEA